MNSSKTALQAAFKAAAFDPRKPGTISTIVACNDPDYLTKRAEEMLRDSERFTGVEKWARLRDAAAVIAYSMTLIPASRDAKITVIPGCPISDVP